MVTVGVDEVGRGCWAGPVTAGAVVLDAKFCAGRIRAWKFGDSKLLTKREREVADAKIRVRALAIGIGWASITEIDKLGLTEAVRLAMQRALEQIRLDYDEIIIDGNYNFFAGNPRARTIIKADASIPAVSAASIVAKVARDAWMAGEAAKQFPAYGFERHVGYGTALHREMVRLHGVCALHRRSFQPVRSALEQAA